MANALDYAHDPLGAIAYKRVFEPLNELATICYRMADEKGFHSPRDIEGVHRDASAGERIALMHSEVSEMLEALREFGEPASFYYSGDDEDKPEGVASELADVIIRALDYAAAYGIAIGDVVLAKMKYNATRGFRHGDKVL